MVTLQQTQILTPQVHIKGPGGDDGLDALISGHAAQKPEAKKEIEILGKRKFGELWIKYERAFSIKDMLKIDVTDQYLDTVIDEVLTPLEIEEFLRLTVGYEEYADYSKCTTKTINKLIKNSYNAGHNEFVLDTRNLLKQLDNLCANLNGNQDKPLRIIINGNVGKEFGTGTDDNIFFIINGDVGSCGIESTVSFTINGNVGYISGPYLGSFFNINGNLKHYYDHAFGSYLTINGEIGDFKVNDSGFCIFKTSNPKTLEVFLKHTPLIDWSTLCGNRLYFINKDGTEREISIWERISKKIEYKLKRE